MKKPNIVQPDDILETHDMRIQKLAEKLRSLIKEIVPEIKEKAYPGWRGIGYTHPKIGYFCAIFPFDNMVELG